MSPNWLFVLLSYLTYASLPQTSRVAPAAVAPPAAVIAAACVTDGAGFIPYWIGLGPIPVSKEDAMGRALDEDFLKGELTAKPRPGDEAVIKGRSYRWKAVTTAPASPSVDINASLDPMDYAAAYLVTYISVNKDTPARLFWGSDNSGAVFVNGIEVGRSVGARGCEPDESVTAQFLLHRGINRIMMKIINEQYGFAGCARLVDTRDFVVPNVPISPTPNGPAAEGAPPEVAAWPIVTTDEVDPGGAVGSSLVVDHAGYRPDLDKIAIGAAKTDHGWTSFELCDAGSGQVVFTVPKDGGSIGAAVNAPDLGKVVTRVSFGPMVKPGVYMLKSAEYGVESLPFRIGPDVYRPTAVDAMRAFFFQQFGQAFSPKHAGVWAGPAYHDPKIARQARVCSYIPGAPMEGLSGKSLEPNPHDVSGGWYDSGEPGEYMRNECLAHNRLLLTYDMNPEALRHTDLNLPESVDGFPDILNEARYTTAFLLKMQRDDGAFYDRVVQSPDHNESVRIAEPCSGATLCGAAALAWAGAVWKEEGKDPQFSRTCIDAAEKAWRYMDAHPSPWPVTASHQPRNIGSFGGGYGDERGWKMLAAAALYRGTGSAEYEKTVEDYLSGLHELRFGWNTLQLEACHNYAMAPGARPDIVAAVGKALAADANALRNGLEPGPAGFAYGAGSRDGYLERPNELIAGQAAELGWWAWKFAPASDRKSYDQAAEEYLHYLMGRNPTDWCYVTNLQHVGVQKCPQVMYHFLMRGSPRFLTPGTEISTEPQDETADTPPAEPRAGCYPGFLLGGPVDRVDSFDFQPDQFPADAQRLQPSITMQADFVCLVVYCGWLHDPSGDNPSKLQAH